MEKMSSPASIIWRGKYLILAAFLASLAASILQTRTQARVYEATGLIQVASDVPTVGAEVLGLQQASQGLASTYATLITSRSFLARIRPKVEGSRFSTSELASLVNASAVTQSTQNTNLIELRGQGPSPTAARMFTQQVARAFVQTIATDTLTRANEQQTQLQARITLQTQQIDKLSANNAPAAGSEQVSALRATRAALTAELATTIANSVGRQGSVDIVAPAIASDLPIKPRPLLNESLGALLGLLIGVGAAWLRSALDRHLSSSGEVEQITSAPVLASIPLRRSVGLDDLVTREAYDVLRTNLTFLALESPLAVLTITSSESGEGKSATAEGLARAAARRDLRVLLVDADLRTGELSARLGAARRDGLVNVLAAGAHPTSVVIDVAPNLSLLAAGPAPPDPPSLLANSRMAKLADSLRQRYDLIVIDTPPIGHLADAAILAALSDASILVARTGRTERVKLAAAAAALGRTPAPIAGVVVFERRPLDATYYPPGGADRGGFKAEATLATPHRWAPPNDALQGGER